MQLEDFEVLVINLEKDFEKKISFTRNFEKKISDFKFFPAINGRDLNAYEYFMHINRCKGRAKQKIITPSEVGCFLSHKEAINHFLKSSKETLLIFEDDIYTEKQIDIICKINFSEDRIYILGGQNGMRRPKIFSPFLKKDRPINIPPLLNSFIYRTCCYAINKKTAKKLINIYEKNTFLADDWSTIVREAEIEGISYINLFEHPIDLTSSNIEEERKIKR